MSDAAISVVIPTLNAGASLSETLDVVTLQQTVLPGEVVVIDSGSTDGTRERARSKGCRVVELETEEFNHGATRNRGVEETTGDLVVMLVQDALPLGQRWLERLTAPFHTAPDLAGAFARQLPRPSAGRITRESLSRWIAGQEQARLSSLAGREEWELRSPWERFELCAFDNVCSCIRRSVWREIPFRRCPIAEDLDWAKGVLLAGYRTAFVPAAVVAHSHDRPVGYELRRTYWVHRRLYELFGLRTLPRIRDLVRAWPATLIDHANILRRGAGPRPQAAEVVRALGLALGWPLAQYLGGWSAERSVELLSPRGI